MKYMIVAWTIPEGREEPTWVIVHYSHKIDDVKFWYDHYKNIFATCKLMIDYHEAVTSEHKQSVLDSFASFLDRLIK